MKDLFIETHEELVEEYLEQNPKATWEEAYNLTADNAYEMMKDKIADMIDYARLMKKEGK